MTNFILLAYLLVLSIIAFRSFSRVKNYADFFIARKKGSYSAITGSLVATILGGSAVIGAIDAGKTMGWATAWFMLCASIGLLALLPLTAKISRLGRFTLPDLLEDLYGTPAKKIASLVIPVAWLGIVAAQLIASARILQSFTGLNYQLGVLVSGVVFIAYTIAGGQLSVLKTDIVQAFLVIVGLGVLVLFALKLNPVQPVREFPLQWPFNVHFSPFDLIILLLTYSTTFTAGPDIYSRIFCASDERTARKSVFTAALILIPVAIMIAYLSVLGATMEGTNTHGATLVELSKAILPEWVIPLMVIALLSAVLSSADTTILSSSIILTDLISKSRFNEKTLLTTRIIILITGIIAMVIAINFTSIIGMLLIALTVYSGAFILPILFGLSKLNTKSRHVSWAIMAGGTLALAGKLLESTAWSDWSNWVIIAAFAVNGLILLTGMKSPRKKLG